MVTFKRLLIAKFVNGLDRNEYNFNVYNRDFSKLITFIL